jgi:hypothetical protein
VQRPEIQRKYPADDEAGGICRRDTRDGHADQRVDLAADKTRLIATARRSNCRAARWFSRDVASTALPTRIQSNARRSSTFAFPPARSDETAFAYWMNTLKNKPLRDAGAARSLVCSFLNSEEYQSRFGILTTHTTRECN